MNTTIPQMISALLAAYELSEEELAKRLGCSQATVNRFKSGEHEPRYGMGLAIHALWLARPGQIA